MSQFGFVARFAPALVLLAVFTNASPAQQTTSQTAPAAEALPDALQPVFSAPEANNDRGSVFIPLDSWIYPAMERLYSLGYIDSAYLGLRPWTRLSCVHILQETYPKLEVAPQDSQAWKIFLALAKELGYDPLQPSTRAAVDTLYVRPMYIKGPPLNDSYHFGQTLINDYGRPYQQGFNDISGFIADAGWKRWTLDVRGEYQHAPGRAPYPESVLALISQLDEIPQLPYPNLVPQINTFTLLDANLSVHVLGHEISAGKSEDWWGPTQIGPFALSNNAQPFYALRINRVEPLHIPLLSDVVGPFRYAALLGDLKGHRYPNAPWIQAQKFSFKPTRNLEFGFSRVIIFAGKDHVPFTFGSFWNSFSSFSNVSVAQKQSRNDPGFRTSTFDFTYRLPWLEKWVTVYTDSMVHDDTSPIDAPRRAAISPGIYLSHLPKLPNYDLRVEAVSTDPPGSSQGGYFMYWEYEYRDGYLNDGNLLGSWIGREGKGGEAWLTRWISPSEYIQLSYRNAKVSKTFVPGGTTQNDFNVRAVLRLKSDLELNAFGQIEFWKVPALEPQRKSDFTGQIQLTYYPKVSLSGAQSALEHFHF